MHQYLTCNTVTHYNSYILHAMAQPFVAGKLYLHVSLQILHYMYMFIFWICVHYFKF